MIDRNAGTRKDEAQKPPCPGVVFVTDPTLIAPAELSQLRAAVMDTLQHDNPNKEIPIGDIKDLTVTVNGTKLDIHIVNFDESVVANSLTKLVGHLQKSKIQTLMDKIGLTPLVDSLKSWLNLMIKRG